MTPLFIASDHAGYKLKASLIEHLVANGHKLTDLGTNGLDSVDYPDFGFALAKALNGHVTAKGIAICGSGIGISIAANRFSWVRAALIQDVTSSRLSRQHNDANVIALGARMTDISLACECVDAFLTTDFEGGRHARRIDKLTSPNAND